MIFTETKLRGAYIIEPEQIEDERGFFARTFCRKEFEAHGLSPNFVQCDIYFNRLKHTLRGLHYQAEPHQEAKLVRCTRGAIWDVIVDLRKEGSNTFGQWFALELTADNHKMMYISEGFAHGLMTLCDDAEVFYQISTFYKPGFGKGIRWDDPSIGIRWPEKPACMSERDRDLPFLDMQ